ncbi:zinc ribbon domain-containing protein [Devosia rhodophyticola]|uniref:Zinc ribbon domain-containing protein n=1 Tax=Devosia rhodophyticola TaxID=3026423 RepID=A0ABY7YYW7_9HYPH|nr:zinc ribbon domain-containing protein [Devosia rhodophyticola]WDR06268.1 zinc ribbon domain-containing protein [Devosia rhodophyticola]
MISYELALPYSLEPGWLAPYVEALQKGRAMGRSCSKCGSVSFPPQRRCQCGSGEAQWVRLSGKASVLLRTHGSDGTFGLVQFEGATNKAVTRLEGFASEITDGHLIAPPSDVPALILAPSKSRSTP